MRNHVLDWIPSTDYAARQNTLQRGIQEGTGQWFLNTADFCTWLYQEGGMLFCPGIPGAGKTHIVSLVIHYLQRYNPFDTKFGLAYIYCEYTQQLTRETLLGSLLEQLARMLPCLPIELVDLFERHRGTRTQPSVIELQRVLYDIVSGLKRCFIVVDGLDECTDDDGMRSFLLKTLTELRKVSGANVLTMSRDIHHIRDHFSAESCLEIEVKAPDHDIGMYLNHQIPRVLPLLAEDFHLCQKIKAVVMAGAGGMYMKQTLSYIIPC
jgi:hypothetical protein